MEELLGKKKIFRFHVNNSMFAVFDGELIHPVLSTFWLGYYFEWYSRKVIQSFFKDDINACGSKLSINHKSPAFENDWVDVEVEVVNIDRQIIDCSIVAKVDSRIIAEGKTSQFVSTQSFFNDQFKPRKQP